MQIAEIKIQRTDRGWYGLLIESHTGHSLPIAGTPFDNLQEASYWVASLEIDGTTDVPTRKALLQLD